MAKLTAMIEKLNISNSVSRRVAVMNFLPARVF
jgi:hypothetical protein